MCLYTNILFHSWSLIPLSLLRFVFYKIPTRRVNWRNTSIQGSCFICESFDGLLLFYTVNDGAHMLVAPSQT